jgi:hypothetical protein
MNTSKGILNASMGQYGMIVGGAGTYSESHGYVSILALEDSVVTATGTNVEDFTSITIPAGVNVPGFFSSVTIASGNCVIYKGLE